MKFRTEYKATPGKIVLDPSKPVVMAGSCFSQNIAAIMEAHGWKAVNPLGTLYNPFSIFFAIDIMLDDKKGAERFNKSLFQYEGIWNSDKFDSSFSSKRKEDCLQEFLNRQKIFIENLSEGRTLIVTFGTSIVYHNYDTYEPVGNCHKRPALNFSTKRLTPTGIMADWSLSIERLKEVFPDIKIIFTVSPVRHLKDGFVGNARSKAVLLLGVEEICKYNEGCVYFPAYEILNDDLRDYRFYASDLVHPSQEGIEYIWEKFKDTFLNENGLRILEEGSRKYKANNHRPKTGALGLPLH